MAGHSHDLSFPLKLHYIMEQEPRVLKWNVDQKSFRIIDEDALVGRVLQEHFRTGRLSSFTRNLNIYGFKKIAKGEFAGSYYHPNFRKGSVHSIALMRRCSTRKIKTEGRITTKEPSEKRVKVKLETAVHPHHQGPVPHGKGVNTGTALDCCFLDGNAGVGALPHTKYRANERERALPSSNEMEAGGDLYSTPFEAGSFLSTEEHFQNPFTEDDDLVEWKKVLSLMSDHLHDHDGGPPSQPAHPSEGPNAPSPPAHPSEGPNAYCVHVPAGPLGIMIEKRGGGVCLSKFTNPKSPLAHVPLGSQLVNLDGRDTTTMVVCQITKLDKSVRHRARMVIFMAARNHEPCNPSPRTPVPLPQHPQESKVRNNDVDMECGDLRRLGCDDSNSPVQQCMPVSAWLSMSGMQSFYEAI